VHWRMSKASVGTPSSDARSVTSAAFTCMLHTATSTHREAEARVMASRSQAIGRAVGTMSASTFASGALAKGSRASK
jgi:hypothetical protein